MIAVLEKLVAALGERVLTDSESIRSARTDRSGKLSDGLPLCVIEAQSTEDVVQVLKVAQQEKVPVVTRGGGSGLAGGAAAGEGEIVLSLAKMNRIIEISKENRWARVEAGVINEELNNAAKQHGMWFAPDPASRAWSTVGGNIATNAGGLLCTKYGVTRDAVRELIVVLASGEVLTVGHKSIKGVSGFDLVSLFVGSEGTLGVITEALVTLKPMDKNPVWTLTATVPTALLATRAVQETIAGGLTPSVLELIDESCAQYISNYLGQQLSPGTRLIAQADGADAASEAARIANVWEKCGLEVRLADESEDLIAFRRAMLPALESMGKVLIEDVAVPISQLSEMFSSIRDIERKYNLVIPTVAHAADGNLHPNFIYASEEIPAEIWEAADELFSVALSLGGTLTGEHGVGVLKKKWLQQELGQTQWKLQLAIKRVFDPYGILNPGKIF